MADSSNWRDKFAFLTPRFVEHVVGAGESAKTFRFYPIGMRLAFRLKTVGKPLAKALGILFGKNHNDTKQIQRSFVVPETKEQGQETILEGIGIELARYRDERREKAIAELIDTLGEESNQKLIGEIIMDSLRDDCPRRPSADDLTDFMASLTVPMLGEMLLGVAKANFDLSGDLAGKLRAAVQKAAGSPVNQPESKTSKSATPTASDG